MESLEPGLTIDCVNTTFVERSPAAFDELLPSRHWLGTPAALQMPSQMPRAVKSLWTDGDEDRWLGWLGFMTHKPVTEDYVPLFPWAGVLLLGVAAGHGVRKKGPLNAPLRPSE